MVKVGAAWAEKAKDKRQRAKGRSFFIGSFSGSHRDVTADGGREFGFDWLVLGDRFADVFQLMSCRQVAGFAVVAVPVVDAASVDEFAAGEEDGGLGGDGGAGGAGEVVLRVEDGGAMVGVFEVVLLRVGGGEVGVGVDEAEGEALLCLGVAEAVDLGGEGVRDGAVVGDKEEDGGLSRFPFQRTHHRAIYIP